MMNIYIVYDKESGKAVSIRYVDEADKVILNGLAIATALYDPDHLGIADSCAITYRLELSRTEAAELFGCVIMDIDPATKQLRSI